MIEGSQWVIERYRPHILMELQPKHLVAGVDADANRIGREYIQKWFDFLRYSNAYLSLVLFSPVHRIGLSRYREQCSVML